MGGESLAHRRLVADLGDLFADAGFVLGGMELPGSPRPRTLAGRRPDVAAVSRPPVRWVIGEAKLGPELGERRTREQLAAFTAARSPFRRLPAAHLVLAVPAAYLDEAWRISRLTGAAARSMTIVGWLPDAWLLTWLPSPRRATFPAWHGVAIRVS